MDPRAMAQAMKQLGITQEDLPDVEEVLIRTKTKEITIRPADVTVMTTKGERSWQITGTPTERPRGTTTKPTPTAGTPAPDAVNEEDLRLVMEQTGADRTKALAALKKAGGEPAQAIVDLLG